MNTVDASSNAPFFFSAMSWFSYWYAFTYDGLIHASTAICCNSTITLKHNSMTAECSRNVIPGTRYQSPSFLWKVVQFTSVKPSEIVRDWLELEPSGEYIKLWVENSSVFVYPSCSSICQQIVIDGFVVSNAIPSYYLSICEIKASMTCPFCGK